MQTFESIENYQNSFKLLNADLIQLEKGAFQGQLERKQLNSCAIIQRKSKAEHIHRSTIKNNCISLVFPNNLQSYHIQINGVQLTNKNQIIDCSGETINAIMPADFNAQAVVLDKRVIEQILKHEINALDSIRKVEVNQYERLIIASKIRYANAQLDKKSFLKNNIAQLDLEASIYQLATQYISESLLQENTLKPCFKAREKRRVIELLYSLPSQKLNVETLAKEAYISVRKLHYLCKHTWGRTPNQMLTNARFRRVNHKLAKGSFHEKSFISKLLKDFGITNISRFSQYYLTLFGETPAETLKNNKVRLP